MPTRSLVGKYKRAVKRLESLRRLPVQKTREIAGKVEEVERLTAQMTLSERLEVSAWLAGDANGEGCDA
jgi:hypothetical protein